VVLIYILGDLCTRSTAETILPRQESRFYKSSFSLTAEKQAHLRDTHKGINCCYSTLATSKRISLATNCKIFKEKIVLRVENKIVGGFRCLKCVKILLFITTFCRLTRCRMMNMTSKSDATAICVVESDNEYENSDVLCIRLPDGYYETCAKF
jgi:hypothetical protein